MRPVDGTTFPHPWRKGAPVNWPSWIWWLLGLACELCDRRHRTLDSALLCRELEVAFADTPGTLRYERKGLRRARWMQESHDRINAGLGAYDDLQRGPS